MTEQNEQLMTTQTNIDPGYAPLNITYENQNGSLADPVLFDSEDSAIKQMAAEAIMSGSVRGIAGGEMPDLSDYVVDRISETSDIPYPRLLIRPKTPFGT
jgi:hypothetical protein